MAVALETVVKQLADSGIIAPGKLEHFVPPKAHPTSVEDFVRKLVKENHLTRFQAAQVAAGKARMLIVGGYTLLDKIGAGGMGQVYKAVHRRMDRVVAIKMLPPAMTKDGPAVARFEREVRAAAKLEHPNIVSAYDADQSNGTHFLVMQYVDGLDLSALVKKNGPFPPAKAIKYILQAARGLEFAHKKGIVHRDIKPANLLLDADDTVKVLDMGLARIDAGADDTPQAEITGSGAIMGTVDYMAPEQALNTKTADERADIYGLGCSLHYLVTGKPVYSGDTLMAKLLAHRENPIPALQNMRPDLPDGIDAVFQKMVAKRVGDRYQSMSEVIADLEQCAGEGATRNVPGSGETSLDISAFQFLANVPSLPIRQAEQTKKHGQQDMASRITRIAGGRKKRLLIGGGVAGGLVLLLALMFAFKAKSGVLVIKVNVPGAEVMLDDRNKVEITRKGDKGALTLSVDSGKHRLKVQKNGFVTFEERIEIAAGEKKPITIELEPLKPASDVLEGDHRKRPWDTVKFQTWMTDAAELSAEEQVAVFVKRMKGLNRGFDGKVEPTIENGIVTQMKFNSDYVTDLSPLRLFGRLTYLKCAGSDTGLKGKLSDLSPLEGLTLTGLDCSYTQVSDLSPLKYLPLTHLDCGWTPVSDLSPIKGMPIWALRLNGAKKLRNLSALQGMPLQSLSFDHTKISDLSPLKGMPLRDLHLGDTPVSDLSPLKECPNLEYVHATLTKVTARGVDELQKALPACRTEWNGPPP